MTNDEVKLLWSIGVDVALLLNDKNTDSPEFNAIISKARKDIGIIDKSIIKEEVINSLEAIGILTHERKQQRDKEAFAQATTEGKINMLAERLGLK